MYEVRLTAVYAIDPLRLTRVSSDGIRRQSMTARMAIMSLMQQYIRPVKYVSQLQRSIEIYVPLHVRSIDDTMRVQPLIFSLCSKPLPYASVMPDSAIYKDVSRDSCERPWMRYLKVRARM